MLSKLEDQQLVLPCVTFISNSIKAIPIMMHQSLHLPTAKRIIPTAAMERDWV